MRSPNHQAPRRLQLLRQGPRKAVAAGSARHILGRPTAPRALAPKTAQQGLMALYTKTGDEGETGLFGNRRVSKDDLRIEAYGVIDELNSCLGVLRSETLDPQTEARIQQMQNLLFECGADLATDGGCASVPAVTHAIAQMETWIDESEVELPPLRNFILPGGSRAAGLLHVARTIARRAERRFWTLAKVAHDVPRPIGVLLNRMSDLFFSWARRANVRAGVADVPWTRQKSN